MRYTPQVQQVRLLALTVFGDIDTAATWLGMPNLAFGGVTPEVCADSAGGLQRVLQVLSAIETGSVV